jgi:hypothetical protein
MAKTQVFKDLRDVRLSWNVIVRIVESLEFGVGCSHLIFGKID